jgi:hypothetical protein
MTPEQRAACKEKCCNSAVGKVLSATLQPVSAFSGGLITDRCALPTAAELAQPADSAGGAAARIKADEAAAAARRADVRYLGTVDCSRWPEAELALINALRGDRNECVRLEAALALARGCCCTPKTVAALSIVVSGSNRDGFPVEKSERVRYAAGAALDHCLACLQPIEPVLPLPIPVDDNKKIKEKLPGEKLPPDRLPADLSANAGAPIQPAAPVPASAKGMTPSPAATAQSLKKVNFYENLEQRALMPLVHQARQKLEQPVTTPAATTPGVVRTEGLFHIVGTAFSGSQASAAHMTSAAPSAQVFTPMPSAQVYSPAPSAQVYSPAPQLYTQAPATTTTTHSTVYVTPPIVVAPPVEEAAPRSRGLLPMIFPQRNRQGASESYPADASAPSYGSAGGATSATYPSYQSYPR